MAQQIVLTAGPASKTAVLDPGGAVGSSLVRSWKLPPAVPKRRTAPGQYGDRPLGPSDYEPRQFTFGIERVGAGSAADSEAWLESWEAAASAANIVENATLAMTSAGGNVLTFDVIECTAEATNWNSMLWNGGLATVDLTVKVRAAGRAPRITSVSSLPAATNGVTYWSGPVVPGDLPALVDVEASWAATPNDRRAIVQTGPHTIIRGADLLHVRGDWATTSSPGVTGAANATVLAGSMSFTDPEYVGEVPLTATEIGWGSLQVLLRIALKSGSEVFVGGSYTTVELRSNGVLVERKRVANAASLSTDDEEGPWRSLRFGSVPTNGALSIWLGCEGGTDAVIDLVALQRGGDDGAVYDAGPPAPGVDDVIDNFVLNTSAMNGRAPDHGPGTWTAGTGWAISSPFFATSGPSLAVLSHAASRLEVTVEIDDATQDATIALTDGSDLSGRYLALFLERSASGSPTVRASVAWVAHTGGGGTGGLHVDQPDLDWPGSGAVPTFRATVAIDAVGRWFVSLTRNGAPAASWQGHAPGFAYASMHPCIGSTSGGATFLRMRSGSVIQPTLGAVIYGTAGVARPITDATAFGDRVTARAGELCRGIVMAGDTAEIDTPPSSRPSSLAVKITPLFLDVAL